MSQVVSTHVLPKNHWSRHKKVRVMSQPLSLHVTMDSLTIVAEESLVTSEASTCDVTSSQSLCDVDVR